ncbi:rod-binding protein [Pararhizobium sp.]|uniref:rod-binding protein n=1 Tax=Pararhizobium sp. TaxID=1977563 RepID=UPI00271EC359|nr:rod-binding protein [Pararhizobium sp.]MDO9418260.1 rod-binding protein [Pararhizobium sp.]
MAISPVSDLVLDVVRAADPAQVQEAQSKLKSDKAAFQAASLAESGNGFGTAVNLLNRADTASGLGDTNNRAKSTEVPPAYRKFEAMVLQNFVKSMLPAENEEIYGKGVAGDMWKSMMAEQIGNVIAEDGGIGIAQRMMTEGAVDLSDDTKRTEASLDGNTLNVAASMVQEYQRKAFDDLMPGADDSDKA